MDKLIRTVLLFLLFSIICAGIKAQEGLNIASIFQKYGKQKGVTMTELSKSMLDSYQISLYKSVVFKDVTDYLPEILKCLERDKKEGDVKKMQEVVEDGKTISAYYQLTPIGRDKKVLKRYILFKIGEKNKATLIYIEGTLDADELTNLLFRRN